MPKRFARLELAVLLLVVTGCTARLEPAGQPVRTPVLDTAAAEKKIVQADGAILPLKIWLPENSPTAVIVALHGFNDYSNAFTKPGTYWAKAKRIATYAFDQRGFGGTPHRGIWAGHATMTADLAIAIELVRKRHPNTPLFVLGESMGGSIAIIAAAEEAIRADGLILAAPALRGRRYLGVIPRTALAVTYRLVPWFRVTGQGLRIQASDNIKMLRALSRDPKVIKGARIDTLKGLVDAMDAAVEAAPDLKIPALVLYGARDELVPKQPTMDLINALPKGIGHRPAVYRTGWHLLLRDLKAKRVLDDIATWIADRGAPLPSGSDKDASKVLAEAE